MLVILGLLVGGVLSGQSLIRAAELRSITTDFSRYMAASRAFRDKYFALPGDMTNATSFWGTDAGGCPGNNTTATAPSIPTCNGDGNGQVGYYLSNANINEQYRFWQQLADAGMIEGSFTGVLNSSTVPNSIYDSITNPNVPKSRISAAHWGVTYFGAIAVSSLYAFDGNFDNIFYLTGGTTNGVAVIKPEEAWNIDTKLDDGKPGTGMVVSFKSGAQANATTGCSDTAYSTSVSIAAVSNYLLTNTAIACSLNFKAGF